MAKAITSAGKSGSISDEAVKAKTGKKWSEWFKILDTLGAGKMSHRQIAVLLSDGHGLSGWWAQTVTVGYEQARGLREVHEKTGGYEISVSRTVAVPVAKAYRAWADAKLRRGWLPEASPELRKATKDKSIRMSWSGTRSDLEARFYGKGDGKSQVVVQHSRLADSKEAARMKKFWARALDRFKGMIEG